MPIKLHNRGSKKDLVAVGLGQPEPIPPPRGEKVLPSCFLHTHSHCLARVNISY